MERDERQDLASFHDRAQILNIVGQLGAGICTVWLSWDYAEHGRLLTWLAIQQTLVVVMAFAFAGRIAGDRRDRNGLPAAAFPLSVIARTCTGSALIFAFESADDIRFVYAAMIVMFACAAGVVTNMGPILLHSRTALLCLLVPGAVVALLKGHPGIGLGTFFFLAVVAGSGLARLHASYQELSELRAAAAEQARSDSMRARIDELTGLLNRRAIRETYSKDQAGDGVLLYGDLDRFKEVNDTAGHSAGDELLTELARRLVEATPHGTAVSRIGGDEFVILLTAEWAADPEPVAARIREAVSAPFRLQAGTFEVGISLGHCRIGPDTSFDEALRVADEAMFRAKAAHRRN